jgi:hypothetical protein
MKVSSAHWPGILRTKKGAGKTPAPHISTL